MTDTMIGTKLIKLSDDTLVEVGTSIDGLMNLSGGEAEKVDSAIDKVQPLLMRVCKPIAAAWHDLSKEVVLERAEIEVGFSFEGEGNLYVTKAKAGANIVVKLTFVDLAKRSSSQTE